MFIRLLGKKEKVVVSDAVLHVISIFMVISFLDDIITREKGKQPQQRAVVLGSHSPVVK